MNDATKEALKELARLCVLAIVPVLLLVLESGTFDYKTFLILAAVAILRTIDKFLHEQDKALPIKQQEENTILKGGGLVGF